MLLKENECECLLGDNSFFSKETDLSLCFRMGFQPKQKKTYPFNTFAGGIYRGKLGFLKRRAGGTIFEAHFEFEIRKSLPS